MLQALDEAAVGRWSHAVVDGLSRARTHLDELNVFPVPDGDTGTNLLLTAQAGHAALTGPATGPGESAWTVWARGAVLGARGNSGAILAQLLSGLADGLAGVPRIDGAALAAALSGAARTAYAAVADPAEGTLLTVARSGAEAAAAAVAAGRAALADVVQAAADGALAALRATPGQLAALRDAGVVDAGGAGWCVVLDALVATVTGSQPDRVAPADPAGGPRGWTALPVVRPPAADPGSEVQFLLADADERSVASLRARLAELGDSLVVVGVDLPGGREWNVHVHVRDVGAALEAGIEAGRPHRISVTPLAPVGPAPTATGTSGARAVVAVTGSPGLAELFAAEGAAVLTAAVAELDEALLLAALLDTGAQQIVVLPNHADLTEPACRAVERAREQGRDAVVVPTRSAVQGLAALAVADPGRRFGDDVVAMAEAAAATRWAEVTVAEQEALTSAGRCRAGDLLGSADGDVVVLGSDPVAVGRELLDRLLSAGGELATLVEGAGASPGLGDAVCAHLAAVHPTVEVVRYAGGPGTVPLLIGVE